MKDFFDSELICLHKESQYEFIYNGETLLSDDCFSNLYGVSSCSIGNTHYSSVTYKTIYSNCIKSIKYKDIFLNSFFISFIFLLTLFFSFKKFL